jgi:hypothetical protein
LPSFNKDALPKIIVKFTRRNVRNEYYAKRKALAGQNLKTNPQVKSFLVGNNIYIYIYNPLLLKGKSFTAMLRKKLNWKFIWTHHGRIYIRKNEAATEHYVFNTSNDLTRPQSLVV